jgi:SAM-dependent methyltransferase
MPFATSSFDLAACLDVIEHLEDDRGGLSELRRVVAPGRFLIVTVPAYERLWSAHDEINYHAGRSRQAHPSRAITTYIILLR